MIRRLEFLEMEGLANAVDHRTPGLGPTKRSTEVGFLNSPTIDFM